VVRGQGIVGGSAEFYDGAMVILLLVPAILSFLLLGVHFLHHGDQTPFGMTLLLMGMCFVTPLLLLIRRRPILWGLQFLLVLASIEWLWSAWQGMQEYAAQQRPVTRYLVIMTGVAGFNMISALLLALPKVKKCYPRDEVSGPELAAVDKNEGSSSA